VTNAQCVKEKILTLMTQFLLKLYVKFHLAPVITFLMCPMYTIVVKLLAQNQKQKTANT